MKNEKILHADDSFIARDGFKSLIEAYGSEDEHELIGQAASKEEVEQLIEEGLQPTVAFIDNKMPHEGDGEKAAQIIRKLSPETIIISLSADTDVTFGDHNLTKKMAGQELIDFITSIKH